MQKQYLIKSNQEIDLRCEWN